MELTEAAQRILRHHLGLILVMVMLGLAVPVALHVRQSETFVATSRLVVGAKGSNSPDATKALADTAQGFMTSPGRVRTALQTAQVQRSADKVASNDVKITAVGTSGVIEVSVSDRNPAAAAKVANALSSQFVEARRQINTGEIERQLNDIDSQLDKVAADVNRVEDSARTATPDGVQALRLLLDNLLQQRSGLTDQRQNLSDSLATAPEAAVIDQAANPQGPESSGLPTRLALGGLLGLVLGVAFAAIVEALRPTIVSPDALARTLGAPVIGHLPRAPQDATTLADPALPGHLRLTARGARVGAVRLASVGPEVDLPRLVQCIQEQIGPYPEVGMADPDPGQSQMAFEAGPEAEASLALAHPDKVSETGIVVVAPEVIKRDQLTPLEHLLVMTQWPLIGIIAYKRSRFSRQSAAKPKHVPVPSASKQPEPEPEREPEPESAVPGS